ncbi:MAG: hypothetical protein U5K69_07775 [Balneolaceae bacterium]|nr:hypothetical protein [Balneolaceae bacterium]
MTAIEVSTMPVIASEVNVMNEARQSFESRQPKNKGVLLPLMGSYRVAEKHPLLVMTSRPGNAASQFPSPHQRPVIASGVNAMNEARQSFGSDWRSCEGTKSLTSILLSSFTRKELVVPFSKQIQMECTTKQKWNTKPTGEYIRQAMKELLDEYGGTIKKSLLEKRDIREFEKRKLCVKKNLCTYYSSPIIFPRR